MKRTRTRRWVKALPGLAGVSALLIGTTVGCSSYEPEHHARAVHHEAPPCNAPAPGSADELAAMKAQLNALQSQLAQPAPAPGGGAQPAAPAPAAPGGNAGAQEAAKQWFQQALQAWENANFSGALDNVERALSAWPEYPEAKELRGQIALALGESGSDIQDVKKWYEAQGKVMIQQAQAEVQVNFEKGMAAYHSGHMKDAVDHFTKVDQRFKVIPIDIGLSEIRDKNAQYLVLARKGAAKQEAEIAGMQRAAAVRLAQNEATKEVQAKRLKIRQMFEQALVHFEERRYDAAEELCNACLGMDPQFRLAKDLKVDAMRAKHNKEYADFLRSKIERWKTTFEDIDEATIPYADSDLVRWPGGDYWDQVRQRQPLSTIAEEKAVDEDVLAIQRVLDNTKIDLDFTDASLEDIIGFIREYAKINIEIDQKVREEGLAEKKITFQMRDAILRNVLNLLLRQYALGYTFDHKVLLIVKQDQAEGAPVVVVHDVRDLLRPISDFAGPTISLASGAEGDTSNPTAAFQLAEEPRAPLTGEQLTKLIQDNIEPASWQERSDSVSITLSAQGQLIVVHTPKVQQEVQQFLQNLRSFTGSMVSIETRFLTVSDNFLEDVGVDWRGFNGLPTTPGMTRPDGLTVSDQSGLQNGGGKYDFRFQQLLTYANPAKAGRADFPLGSDLNNLGGLGLEYAFLGDTAKKLVLRALNKTEKATQVSAPRVTAFNAQRAHILVAEQQAYIRDYDVEIATSAAAYDPIIGIVQDGLVLDVRPIISNDRKYITLEMRPTVANLVELRLFDITPDNRPDTPTNPDTYLQLPKLDLQRAQTTVRMPDKGSVLIAGLKNVLDRDLRVETPFLSKIPILGFLFKREGKSLERKTLIILVTAEIIDLGEREASHAGYTPPNEVPLPEDRPVFHSHDVEACEH